MDRHDKLKRLKDEVSRLFYDKVNENEAYNQLQANPNFGSIVKRADIHSMYTHLDKKNKIAAGDEKQIEAWQDEEKQMIANMECMKNYRQDSSKHLLYDGIDNEAGIRVDIWQSRFLVIKQDQKYVYNFKILDMFQNVLKSFTVQKRGIFFRFYFLAFPFVLLHEFRSNKDWFLLLRFDFESDSLQEVQSFEYNGEYYIFVDQFNPSKFILKKEDDGEMHNCTLFNGQIQIGDRVDIEWRPNYFCTSYFNDQLYSLHFERGTSTKILSYNLEMKKSQSFELSPFPEHLRFVDFEMDQKWRCGWIKDHFFTTVRFNLTDEYGIAFAEPKTRKWTLIEFVTKLEVNRIQFVDGQNLMVSVDKNNEEPFKQEVYKVSMRKPDSLRNKAWITLVKKFKKDAKIDDPYAEARKFLPLNSEIHEFIFFED